MDTHGTENPVPANGVSMEPQIGIRGRVTAVDQRMLLSSRFNGAPDRNPGKEYTTTDRQTGT